MLAGILSVVAVIVAFIVLSLIVFNQARQDEAAPADAIVVLGTAQWNGRPSTTFQARLDHAYDLYNEGYADTVVLTGGVAPGDVYSEAEVGATYLRGLGVPAENLVTVPVGLDTRDSLVEAAEELKTREHERVILVSDPFHMFRVKRISGDLGLDPLTSPTSTSPIEQGSPSEVQYIFREVFAYLNYLVFES